MDILTSIEQPKPKSMQDLKNNVNDVVQNKPKLDVTGMDNTYRTSDKEIVVEKTVALEDQPTSIISRDDLIMSGLMKFYAQSYNLNQLLSVLNGESPVSLRVLDWFITNYSKQYDVIYSIKKGDNIRQFAVHNHYKGQLKGYSKKQFDPFCRRKRVCLEFGENQEIETTVGQLNFFKWAIENKVIEYVEANLAAIVNDMNTRGSKAKKDKSEKKTKRELSVSATKSVTKHNVVVTVQFN